MTKEHPKDGLVMLRYVALFPGRRETAIPHKLDQALHAAIPSWNRAINDDELKVFLTPNSAFPEDVHVLRNNKGILLGTLFESLPGDSSEPRRLIVTDSLEDEIERTRGRCLISRCWGRYVLVLRDPAADGHFVLRDPGGALSCYHARHLGADVYFSNISDVAELGMLPLHVDWMYLGSYLRRGSAGDRRTGIREVTEIHPGERQHVVGNTITRELCWCPYATTEQPNLESPEEAALAVRRVVRGSVGAWGRRYRRVIHKLSGGLDSSIVLSCLNGMEKPPDILCLNVFAGEKESDERALARLTSRHLGARMLERERDAHAVDLTTVLRIPKTARPWRHLLQIADSHTFEARLAVERDADTFWSGHGGDGLFFQGGTPFMAADYIRRHGFLSARLRSTLRDTARVTGRPVGRLLWHGLKYGLLGNSWTPPVKLGAPIGFMRPEIARAESSLPPLHPWLEVADGLPPGKLQQLYRLIAYQDTHEPIGRCEVADVIHPLLSQPIIELCLRIPSYTLCAGGLDRATARAAFAQDLPSEIVNRVSKGRMTPYYQQLLVENQRFLRTLLLDGELARARLVDRAHLEACLTSDRLSQGHLLGYMLLTIAAEAWLQSWYAPRPRLSVASSH